MFKVQYYSKTKVTLQQGVKYAQSHQVSIVFIGNFEHVIVGCD